MRLSLAFLTVLPLAAVPRLPLWLEPAPDGSFLAGRQSIAGRSVRLSTNAEMRIAGARPSTAVPSDPLPGVTNDLRGDRSRWRTAIPHYARVRYPSVYPGIDLVYRAVDGSLEFDFELAPGASPARIVLEFDADCRLDRGDLVVGDARLHAPRVFQNGRPIDGEYRLLGPRRAAFRIGRYDRRRSLLIDPVLAGSSVAGDLLDTPVGIATDPAGNVYLASARFITAFCSGAPMPEACKAVIVSKFDPTGTTLVYTTRLGDAGETAQGIAADRNGNAYVLTGSPNDARVRKLDPAGATVLYTRSISRSTTPAGIAVDSNGNAYVTGASTSIDFDAVNALLPQIPVRPMLVSNDSGATWAGVTTLRASSVNSLVVDPARPSTLYAATPSGFFKSIDGGAAWTRMLPELSSGKQILLSGSALYALSDSTLARSLDAGATWQDLSSAVPPQPVATVHSFTTLAVDPHDPAALWLAKTSNLYRSADGGSHWTLVHDFTDPGHSTSSGRSILVDPKIPGRVYLCCVADGLSDKLPSIFRTDDNGATWVAGGRAGASGGFWSLQLDSSGALYAGSYLGPYRSVDAGQTWTKLCVGDDPPKQDYLPGGFRIAGDTLLLVHQNGRLYRSTDGGSTWTSAAGEWSSQHPPCSPPIPPPPPSMLGHCRTRSVRLSPNWTPAAPSSGPLSFQAPVRTTPRRLPSMRSATPMWPDPLKSERRQSVAGSSPNFRVMAQN